MHTRSQLRAHVRAAHREARILYIYTRLLPSPQGLVGRCVKATCSKVAGEPFALLQVQYVDQLTETFNLIHFVVLHHYPGGQYTE